MDKDFYKTLGVARDASESDIKRAYRGLAHKFHPDKHKGDTGTEEKFKDINEAYETLKSPEKRGIYDRYGYAGVAGAGVRGAGGFGTDFQDFFGDIFSDFFGARRRPGPKHGVDLGYEIEITFEEAAFGATKKIKIPRTVPCKPCSGSGAKPGTTPVSCPNCRGSGQVRFQQGFLSIARTCSNCRGSGRVINENCHECRGKGTSTETSEIKINIPHGVDTGSRLRLTDEGEYGENGGPPGDLYITINVIPHEFFTRTNDDIYCEVPISFPQAALGTEIEVPSLEGMVKLKIPAGTQTGMVFRLRGKGIAGLQGSRRGDHNVIVKIETPSKLTKKQRSLLEQFAHAGGDDTLTHKKNFLDKVKEILQ